jgi:hypothetical protein
MISPTDPIDGAADSSVGSSSLCILFKEEHARCGKLQNFTSVEEWRYRRRRGR